MTRLIACAAAAAAFIALTLPGTAQARMTDPGLNTAVPPTVQDTHYRPYRHWHNRDRYRRHRYRHCRNERVRVRTPTGVFVFRTERRCAWRYR